MIDLKVKRAELEDAARKCEQQIQDNRGRISFLNGAITLCNELIADQEQLGSGGGGGTSPESGTFVNVTLKGKAKREPK